MLAAVLLALGPGCSLLLDFDVPPIDAAANIDAARDAGPVDAARDAEPVDAAPGDAGVDTTPALRLDEP